MDILIKWRWVNLNTSSSIFQDVQKITVAPQIVIYRNIFKHSKEIIDLLTDDRDVSFFTSWRGWYGQGFRKDSDFNLLDRIDTNNDSNLLLEKQYILEINDCMKFIREDYLTDFDENNGIWPSFISNWDSLKKTDRKYWIDFFRYDVKAQGYVNPSGLIMEYHVDELPVPGETKHQRHVATVNFYLNDEYEGGEICVYDSISNNTYMYKPMPGDAVIMPSTEPFYHGVKPFSKEDRYFLRAFIDSEVKDEDQWKRKYHVTIGEENLSGVTTEESYVEKDLQTMQLSIPSNLIEIKA
jgi:hypothetical protein